MQRSRSIAISGDSASGLTKWRLGSMNRDRPPPQPNELSCSGHSPPLPHTGQSSGWLTSRNSTTAFWACFTRSEVVVTTIPSRTRLLHVLLELGAEVLQHRGHRHRHRVAQHAQAVADDVALDLLEDVEVHRGALALVDALQHLHRPVRPLAAGDALTARLVAGELRPPQGPRDERGGVVGPPPGRR